MNKYLIFVLVVIIAILAIEVVPSVKTQFGGTADSDNVFSGGVSNTTTSITTSIGNPILARNTSRQYAMICNESVSTLRLQFTATALYNAEIGIPLFASSTGMGCYEIDSSNLYLGAIYGIASATSTVSITEK